LERREKEEGQAANSPSHAKHGIFPQGKKMEPEKTPTWVRRSQTRPRPSIHDPREKRGWKGGGEREERRQK
jgi:hypothetical protein